jgi:hypothetical protein
MKWLIKIIETVIVILVIIMFISFGLFIYYAIKDLVL